MKKNLVVNIEGGVGKQILFTSLFPYIQKAYSNVWIYTPYPEVFEGLNGISGINVFMDSSFYKTKVLSDDTTIVWGDPYDHPLWLQHKAHLVEVWAEMLGIRHLLPSREDKKGIGIPPTLNLTSQEKYSWTSAWPSIREASEEKFILVQLQGGQSPIDWEDNGSFLDGDSLYRTYPYDLYVELIQRLREAYPDYIIFRYGLPNEPIPMEVEEDVLSIEPPLPYKVYTEMIQRAHKVICIDSSLQHIAAAANTPAYVIWGETKPYAQGHELHTNIYREEENSKPCRSFCRPLGDDQAAETSVVFPTPAEVMAAVQQQDQ